MQISLILLDSANDDLQMLPDVKILEMLHAYIASRAISKTELSVTIKVERLSTTPVPTNRTQ